MSDLISRKDVLHELDWCDYGLKDWQKWKLKAMVRDIPSAEPERRWIPCSERMPEFGEDVLITLSMGHLCKGEIVIAYLMYDNCNKLFWLDYVHSEPYETDEVLAWMPLPEPYIDR